MIEHSEGIGSIMAAIGAVQADTDHVEKDLRNPHYGNTYASLNAFLRALRPSLASHGLVMTQAPGMDGERVVVETWLYHGESGEWIVNRAAAPLPKDDPQGLGSAVTYLKRYSLASLFALPQEDDDGEAASRRQEKTEKKNGAREAAPELIQKTRGMMDLAENAEALNENQRRQVEEAIASGEAERVEKALGWLRQRVPAANTA